MTEPTKAQYPQMHERTIVERKAHLEFSNFVLEWSLRHDLTMSERLAILSESLNSLSRACVRYERNPERDNDND